jgi:hypothetical protein
MLAAMVAIGSSATAYTDPGLNYICSPMPLSQQNCAGWHNAPVQIAWVWNNGVAKPESGQCGDQTISVESNGTTDVASCTVDDRTDSTPTKVGVRLKIDRTAPTVVGVTPSRPADIGGWWNHPVTFTFAGNDSLSHIASCDAVTYTGPGGPGAMVTGGCHDVAGNYGVASFPLNYDSTPPALNSVKATPESQSATISWNAPDAVRAQVTRAVTANASASTVVYSGPGDHFRDSGITNGKRYTYIVRVYDQADNASSQTVHAKPAVSLGLKPRRNARLARPPRLRWPAIKHAAYYNVQLWRGNRKLITVWPAGAHLSLRRVLHFHGVTVKLRPGHYRWYVWPGYGSRAAHRYGSFIGQSSFALTR